MVGDGEERRGTRWRTAAWGAGALLLLLPLAAMQVTDEVAWGAADFLLAGALVGGTGLLVELAVRASASRTYRAAVVLALAAAVLLVWLNLAVGIVGSEDDPLNLMFGGVLAVGVIGAAVARFRPSGMARALVATAMAQALAGAAALIAGVGLAEPIWPLTGLFAALWLGSAWLFARAARERGAAAPAP